MGLGVRGGNYTKYEYSGHSRQMSLDQTFQYIDKTLTDHEIDLIYPQTHECLVWQTLYERYGSLIYKPPYLRMYRNLQDFLINGPQDRPRHWDKVPKLTVAQNVNYLLDIYILSKCGHLIASVSNGIAFAVSLNGNCFRSKFVFNLGTY